MPYPFTPEQLTALSAEIDNQLRELRTEFSSEVLKGAKRHRMLPDKQYLAIERAAGEEPGTFLQRFIRVARKDLCEEGGVLYGQWKKWGD